MKWLLVCGFQLLFLACSVNLKSNKGTVGESEIQFDVHEKVLSNGLKLLVVENRKLPVFSYFTYFKVGSKYEHPGITGSSHLLEHMMFKGAKKYGKDEFDKLVSGNGGTNNAYTTNDLTVYYESLPSQHLEMMIDLEADRMQNLLLEAESFQKERNVVLEERKMRYENSDRGKIYLSMMNELFQGTPYGSSVIGEVEDLKTVSREEVWDYFQRFYAPNNAVIIIVGDVDHRTVFRLIERKFAGIAPNQKLEQQKKSKIDRLGFDFKVKLPKRVDLKGTSPVPVMMTAYPGIKIGERDGFVLDILSSVLGGGESSYLSRKYVLSAKPSLSSIYAANLTLQNSGVFFIGGKLLDKASLRGVQKNLPQTLKLACDRALTERAVQKVKNQYLFSIFSDLDTNSGIARFLGDREVFYGDYDFYKKEMQIYDSITLQELRQACVRYLVEQAPLDLSIWNKH